jgi:hypothetical protein
MDASDSLYALWVVVLLNLVLTLRLLAWLLPLVRMRAGSAGARTELRVGAVAPAFRAVALTGERVTEQTYAGRLTTFVFVSPGCGACRTLLPMVQAVGAAADAAGAAMVLATDVGAARARGWLDSVEHEDGVRMTLPLLAAPPSQNPLLLTYNAAGYFPYFVLVSGDGVVEARGIVGMNRPEWQEVVARWIPPPAPAPVGPQASVGPQAPVGSDSGHA